MRVARPESFFCNHERAFLKVAGLAIFVLVRVHERQIIESGDDLGTVLPEGLFSDCQHALVDLLRFTVAALVCLHNGEALHDICDVRVIWAECLLIDE